MSEEAAKNDALARFGPTLVWLLFALYMLACGIMVMLARWFTVDRI